MADLQGTVEDLKRIRDEIRVKLHLASRDLRDQWDALEHRVTDFENKAQLGRSSADLGAAAEVMGHELRAAYERIRNAL
jgi:hypothetical protein